MVLALLRESYLESRNTLPSGNFYTLGCALFLSFRTSGPLQMLL